MTVGLHGLSKLTTLYYLDPIPVCFKAGTHEATCPCNTLLQQIPLCASSDKSNALFTAISCSDKSPGVNANNISHW